MTAEDHAELRRLLAVAATELRPAAPRNIVEHVEAVDRLLVIHLPVDA